MDSVLITLKSQLETLETLEELYFLHTSTLYSRISICDHLSLATISHKRPPIQNTKILGRSAPIPYIA